LIEPLMTLNASCEIDHNPRWLQRETIAAQLL
jgi:hypothetical protein